MYLLHSAQYDITAILGRRMLSAMQIPSYSHCGSFDVLPPELFLETLSYLDPGELAINSLVCKQWYRASDDPSLWRKYCRQRRWTVSNSKELLRAGTSPALPGWKLLVAQRIRAARAWESRRCQSYAFSSLPMRGGHDGPVLAMQLRNNLLLSGGFDGSIRFWDLESRRLVGSPLQKTRTKITCLRFDPANLVDLIVIGGSKGELASWRFSNRTRLGALANAHDGKVTCMRLVTHQVITGSADCTIKIWSQHDLTHGDKDGLPILTLLGHRCGINAIDVRDDLLVSASADHTLRIWNVQDGSALFEVTEPGGISCVRFDADTIVSGGRDNAVRLYDCTLRLTDGPLRGHTKEVRSLQTRIGEASTAHIVTGSHDGTLVIWKRCDGAWTEQRRYRKTTDCDRSIVAVDFNLRWIACTTANGTIDVWDFLRDEKH